MATVVIEPEYLETADLVNGIRLLRAGNLSCNADKVRIAEFSRSEVERGEAQTRGSDGSKQQP